MGNGRSIVKRNLRDSIPIRSMVAAVLPQEWQPGRSFEMDLANAAIVASFRRDYADFGNHDFTSLPSSKTPCQTFHRWADRGSYS